MGLTFGIEEEFVLLDPSTLSPVDVAPEVIATLGQDSIGTVTSEFFRSQVEFASPVLRDADEAIAVVGSFRRRLGAWARDAGVVAAASGTPFAHRPRAPLSVGRRYDAIAEDIGGLTAEHQINGLHVHVGVPDREDRIRASNAVRPWIPALLALSANSPFWDSRDTGFASWRALHSRRWTTYGIPPVFRDAAHYDATVRALTGLGVTKDPGTINWSVRLSARHPTVEIRVFDAQLDPWSTVGLAAVARILVSRAVAVEERPPDIDTTDAALWHAARHGLDADLVDPRDGRLAPAPHVLRGLFRIVAPHVADPTEREAVADLFIGSARHGNGAAQQRAALARSRAALGDLYRARLAEPPPAHRPDRVEAVTVLP